MLYKPSGSLPSSGPNRKSGGGGTLNIVIGLILLLVGIAFIANVFISYSLPGGFFGMFLASIGVVLMLWKSAPKVQKPS